MIPRKKPERFRLRRTMIFLSAQKPGLIKDPLIYGADSLMLDLEDAVAENQKDAARFSLYHALKTVDYGDTEVIVRINGLDTPHWREDVRVCVAAGADGVRIAKCESTGDVIAVEKAVEAAEEEFRKEKGRTLLMAALESPKGILNAQEIAAASERMFGIAISGGDLRRTMQVSPVRGGVELNTARGLVVLAARAAGVRIVTGDTKVVERGKGDGIYINTAGAGVVRHGLEISPSSVRPGDSVLVSGDLGRHGMTIMSLRAGLSFGEGLESDSAPLHESVAAVVRAGIPVHCLRDVTRGGLTATLSEIAESSGLTVKLDEVSIPVREDVRAACGLLGLDPLQVACEGRYLAILPREHEEEALRLMRGCGVSAGACAIGRVEEFGTAPLLMTGRLGVERVLGMPSGMQLPRIC